MTADKLDPCIITKSCAILSNRQRMAEYRNKLDAWLENAPAEAEVIAKAKDTGNISKFLRRGGK